MVAVMSDRMQSFGKVILQGVLAATFLYMLSFPAAYAYPEYQQFVEKHSGRTVNCAMCHVNENGPTGDGHGQIGALNREELNELNKARAALAPGRDVDSPILNRFGNEIIKAIGRKKFIELKTNPAKLTEALSDKSDLDDDGIADSLEFLDGTDPLNQFHGDPAKLFWINLNRYKMHVVLAIVAILSLDYGLAHLIKGIPLTQSAPKRHE